MYLLDLRDFYKHHKNHLLLFLSSPSNRLSHPSFSRHCMFRGINNWARRGSPYRYDDKAKGTSNTGTSRNPQDAAFLCQPCTWKRRVQCFRTLSQPYMLCLCPFLISSSSSYCPDIIKMSSSTSSPHSQLCQSYAYHFKEYSCSDSHPVQLDLKGSIEGEVAMVIATAPFRPITAIVDINVQGDCFLLWNCGSWERRGKKKSEKDRKSRNGQEDEMTMRSGTESLR